MSNTTASTVTQYGFFFDQSRCIGCYYCSVACKAKNNHPPGAVRWLRLFNWEKGAFPDVTMNALFAPCYHCENPVCVDAAGDGSLIKEPKYGAVLIDPEKATNLSLRAANAACPYGAILFDSDAPNAKASMCDMCIDLLETGSLPVCVLSCPTRALDFGPFSDLQKRYGTNRDLPDVPSSSIAKPAIVFKPRTPRKQVIPYDTAKALNLLASRDPLPKLYSQSSDVTDLSNVVIGRSKLNMHASGKELIQQTQNDD